MPAAKKANLQNLDTSLLRALCQVHAPSGEEHRMKAFLLNYVYHHQQHWKSQPQIIEGPGFQDCLLLRFGQPRTALFAHMDTVGFTVRYFNQLLPIGSPEAEPGTKLTGRDHLGEIECELDYDHEHHALYRFGRSIARGTSLVYKVVFKESNDFIQSAYLDNRLGIYNALAVAETLQNGMLVFSCWEEHGGGSVPYLARYLYEEWNISQALISDITWCSDGIAPGKGVVISLRDRNIPRKVFTERIVEIARQHNIPHQLEVEGEGSSDGGELQRSPYPFDWCFVGAPQQFAHTPHEKVHKADIRSMIAFYRLLMQEL